MNSDGVPMRFRTLVNIHDTAEEVTNFEYSGLCYLSVEQPNSVEDALREQCWRKAMVAKMELIQSNKTWELALLPTGHCAIGFKWVFKVKKDPKRQRDQAQGQVSSKRLCPV